MHTATLLHDDVVDESEMRRGRLAARMLWGNEASVLVGDFLLGQAFKMMVEVGSLRALDILSSAAAVIAEGEVMQLGAAKNTATTEDEYLAVIRAKTAELFAAACEVGPTIAGRSKDEQAACRSYGMNLGIAFQLVDDALDYGGKSAKLGKNVGDDFRDGKITLPVVLSYRRGSESERVVLAPHAGGRRRDRPGPRNGGIADDQAPRARGHDQARAPLRLDRHRRARAVSGFRDEDRAGRSGRVFDRAVELAQARRTHPPAGLSGLHPARAPPRRSADDPNRPKQVAPEPDMRASRQFAERSQRAQHVRDHRLQLDRRGLQIVAPRCQQRTPATPHRRRWR